MIDTPGRHTSSEILSQPEAWAATLEALRPQTESIGDIFRHGRYETLVFTGCGSTYYLSLAAAALARDLVGTPAWGVPASEIWLRPRGALPRGRRTLLVAVSRSGQTTETVRACESFLRDHARADLVTLSCYPGRPLTELGELNLTLPAGQEESVAQTRAFTCLYLATVVLAAIGSGSRDLVDELSALPSIARRLLDQEGDRARHWAAMPSLERFYFLGSGPVYGLACELSLKMKEMSLSHSEPFHFLEFRHGPQAMADEHTLIIGLVSEGSAAAEQAVLEQMRGRGASTLSLGETGTDVAFASGLPEALRGALYLPVGQMLGYERAMSRALDPDHPHNLSAVVTLDGP
jgi:glucosamine--fructose-6-phosphate aminotransferase (isomerizing)